MEERKQQIIKIFCTNAERESIIAYITTTRRAEILLAEVRKVAGWTETPSKFISTDSASQE